MVPGFGEVMVNMDRFERAVDKLMKWEPAVAIEILERRRKKYNDMIENSGL